MTILQNWERLATYSFGVSKGLPPESRFFLEAFAVKEDDLLLLLFLEKEGTISPAIIASHFSINLNVAKKSLAKLSWLGWIEAEVNGRNEEAYQKSCQYLERLGLWAVREWRLDTNGVPYYLPTEEDMVFPMAKEVYEWQLERISDNLQQEQLGYLDSEMYLDELDEKGKQMLGQQKDLISRLIDEYMMWSSYVPKYYPHEEETRLK